MATESVSAAPATRANVVGNTFVNKYYNILHMSPEMVFRFYTNCSILSRAETGPSGRIEFAFSQEGINQKIMSLDYRDFRAEIKTVDSLDSLNGSVLVMVTGALSMRGHAKRNFVQTFFLAPQEVGYFVLNDMFRYLDGEPEPHQPPVSAPNGPVGQHVPSQEEVKSEVSPSPQQQTREHSDPPAEETMATKSKEHNVETRGVTEIHEEEKEGTEIEEGVTDVTVVAESHEEIDGSVTRDEEALHSEEQHQEDAPKKSYASILRVRSGVSSPGSSTTVAKPKYIQPPQKSSSPSVSSAAPTTQPIPATASSITSEYATSITSTEGVLGDAISEQGNAHSIYVKNLPLNITVTELDVEFKKFGAIKSGGINLRNQRVGVCFAFIEYEEANSAQSAIEASPILINGRQVYIEEKRPMPVTPRTGRGRFMQGRGYHQNDGQRGGRGYFGGRGFPRQLLEADSGRARDYAPNNVNGYRRTDNSNKSNNSSGWTGPRPTRRGAGNQNAAHGRGSVPPA